jgi:hypothetical protein
VDQGRRRLQRTVTWTSELESIQPAVITIDSIASESETTVVTDHGDYYYEMNKLEQTLTSLSRFIPVEGSVGPLAEQLWQAIDDTYQRKTDTESRNFLPNNELLRIINKDSIMDILTKIDKSFKRRVKFWKKGPARTVEEEAQIICANLSLGKAKPGRKSFRKIFAILILIERPGAIKKFIEEGICDSDLPLIKKRLPTNDKAFSLSYRCDGGEPDIDVKCLSRWKRSTLVEFEQRQWKVLAPFFTRGKQNEVLHYTFKDEVILPFIYREHKRRGAHADIFKVKIHPEHHTFTEDEVGSSFAFSPDVPN